MEFESIVRQYQKQLLVIAFHYCGNRHDAEDAVQDVFVRLYTLKKPFESESHRKNWLIRATINRCKDLLRSPWRQRTIPIEAVSELLAAPYDQDRSVAEAVLSLPQKYREVVLLYYYADYSCNEIAMLLHRRTTTVQTQLQRARALLKQTLKEVWEDEPT